MVAFCGLGCHECGAFWATKENDYQKRAEVAQEWFRLFKVEIKPEDIITESRNSLHLELNEVVIASPKGVAISL